jgi:hypothetical protein
VNLSAGTAVEHELTDKGIASEMARELVEIARQDDAGLTVFAQTMPEETLPRAS